MKPAHKEADMSIINGIKATLGEQTVEFGVMEVYNRKSKALYIKSGSELEVLAYFRSNKHADKFHGVLRKLIKMFK